MPLKCSNNAQCFCLTKMFGKNASIMYSYRVCHDNRKSTHKFHHGDVLTLER